MDGSSASHVMVAPGGTGVVAHVGLHALGWFADRLGLGDSLSARIPLTGERPPPPWDPVGSAGGQLASGVQSNDPALSRGPTSSGATLGRNRAGLPSRTHLWRSSRRSPSS